MTHSIKYNFAANYESLDLIGSITSDAEQMRSEVDQLFNALTSGAYTGHAPEEIHALRTQFSNEMDEIINDLHTTRARAVDQNQQVQDLDNSQAANISC
ncbi:MULTISPECIES: hypothetical protein [Mycobacterium]|uniref:Uncharacterized protein n=1 Tax=Mycobacterium gordonae TaxID=1778 RepID=A0A0Q2QHA0_MYCGO|nr:MULTISPECIES: hypothetical protein [Mycobacterium]KQH79221.1 hypothetical protein AO501_14220 [Mycobacterium gordonae]MDP7727019.1 hypothetical protein [Mycobacterium sp. TY813]